MSEDILLSVRLHGFERIDFDKKQVRKGLKREGGEIRKIARRMIARRSVSSAGQNPGKDSGATSRSIKPKVSRSGFMVIVQPYKTAEMGDDYYPAYLFYGVRAGANRKSRNGTGWIIAKRNNYMLDALNQRRPQVVATMTGVLQDALVPR